ncbi:Protein NRT1/ PTR FAMILY 3.1 [Capsicum baccatum]|uniref:Protein NRT1/ PTR FAMILY 3.1 n=1 Tax=Capsicum baccatum TaxID=33114 RepID=A0A2G2V742_CAPBA|nr:Protein NRT1/ PTR FAMILY 3.1 [Capsicum baccatum]
MGFSMLVVVTIIVYIQDNIGWSIGFVVPIIAMLISIVVFIFGYPLYRNLDPAGSPFTRLLQVCVAAYKKRKLDMVNDPKLFYQNEELDADISTAGKLVQTKQMNEHASDALGQSVDLISLNHRALMYI